MNAADDHARARRKLLLSMLCAGLVAASVASAAEPLTSGSVGNPMTTSDDLWVDGKIITAENHDSAARFAEVIAQTVATNRNCGGAGGARSLRRSAHSARRAASWWPEGSGGAGSAVRGDPP